LSTCDRSIILTRVQKMERIPLIKKRKLPIAQDKVDFILCFEFEYRTSRTIKRDTNSGRVKSSTWKSSQTIIYLATKAPTPVLSAFLSSILFCQNPEIQRFSLDVQGFQIWLLVRSGSISTPLLPNGHFSSPLRLRQAQRTLSPKHYWLSPTFFQIQALHSRKWFLVRLSKTFPCCVHVHLVKP
jgi:hypothetical protein